MFDLYELLLSLLPPRLRDEAIWDEEVGGESVAGVIPLLNRSLQPFKTDYEALKQVWDGQRQPDSSRYILEDRDVDRFITGYLQPWISDDPHLLNVILNVIQELKGTTKGLKLLAYILGVSDVVVEDTDTYTADYCPYSETLFHRYGMGGVYKSPAPDAEDPDCYPGLRMSDGTWKYGSLGLFYPSETTSYGAGSDYGDPIFYWHSCIKYGSGGLYVGDYPYCSGDDYPHRCIRYGSGYLYGDEEVLYCEGCPRSTCIPPCKVILRLFLDPSLPFDYRAYDVFIDVIERYIPACVRIAKVFWVVKLDDEVGYHENLDVIDGSDVGIGLAYGDGSSYGSGDGYGGYTITTSPTVYGYPAIYGQSHNYGS